MKSIVSSVFLLKRIFQFVALFSIGSSLGGCMSIGYAVLSPVMDAVVENSTERAMENSTPENFGISSSEYRTGYTCDHLLALRQEFSKQANISTSTGERKAFIFSLQAVDTVFYEKNCLSINSKIAVAENEAPSENAALLKYAQLGIIFETLTPVNARALKFAGTSGAMVVVISNTNQADAQELAPLDVVVEISGQAVQDADQLLRTLKQSRSGYRAPLRVWRRGQYVDTFIIIP